MPSKALAAALAACALSGCCLVMEGTSQEVFFTSEPPGATFDILGQIHQTGPEPLKIDVPLDDYTIVFRLADHDDCTIELTRQLNSWFFLSILGGVAPAFIDIVTGSWYEFALQDEEGVPRVHAVLKRSETRIIETLIQSDPPGATVSIDGEAQEKPTPLVVRLAWAPKASEKKVEFSLDGYKDTDRKIFRPAEGIEKHVPDVVKLVVDPKYQSIEVTSEPQADVHAKSGAHLGRSNGFVKIEWFPGQVEQTLLFRAKGFEEYPLVVRRDSQATPRAVKLVPIVYDVEVKLDLDPPAAQVESEGNVLPVVEGIVTLKWTYTSLTTTLRFSHPGYEAKDVVVNRDDVLERKESIFRLPRVELTPRAPKSP